MSLNRLRWPRAGLFALCLVPFIAPAEARNEFDCTGNFKIAMKAVELGEGARKEAGTVMERIRAVLADKKHTDCQTVSSLESWAMSAEDQYRHCTHFFDEAAEVCTGGNRASARENGQICKSRRETMKTWVDYAKTLKDYYDCAF